MKKTIVMYIIFISLVFSCSKTDEDNQSKKNSVVNEKIEIETNEIITNKLLSTYPDDPANMHFWFTRKSTYPRNAQAISKEILCSTRWINSCGVSDSLFALIFYEDDIFKEGWLPSGIENSGKYEILPTNKIRLYEMTDSEFDEILLDFQTSINNFWFKDRLFSEDGEIEYYPLGGESPMGERYLYDEISVIKTSGRYVATENLKIRSMPTIESETIENASYSYKYGVDIYIDMFIQGDEISILARTTEKDQIGELENYWYLTKFHTYNATHLGWVFGEYIELYDEKAREYYEELKAEGFIRAGWDGVSDDHNFLP